MSNSLVLDSTTFDGSLFAHALQWMPQGPGPETFEVEIAHNRVGRDLTFAPFGFVAGAVRHIDLSANRVEGEMHVRLPTAAGEESSGLAWKGDIRMSSLHIDGTVALELTTTHYRRTVSGIASAGEEANQRRAIVDDGGKIQNGFRPCVASSDQDARIRVHFEGTDATNIRWALPLIPMEPINGEGCVTWLTWTGTGLRYDRWEPGGGWPSETSNGGRIDAFRSWGDLLQPDASAGSLQHISPDPLQQMANYLWSLGEQSDSRSVRSEAKAAAFPIPAGDLGVTAGNVVARESSCGRLTLD